MKTSGVTRKIDELGRIVIPKEIRRMLSIRDGENLEIRVEGNQIVIKKYHFMKNIEELSKNLIDIYVNVSKNNMLITDREKIVACSCNKNLENKKICDLLLNLIDNRELSCMDEVLNFEGVEIINKKFIIPIVNESDCIGLVIIFNENDKIDDYELNIGKIISKILAEKLNIS